MAGPDPEFRQAVESWDRYWRGTGDTGAFAAGGVNHPTIQRYWDELFAAVRQRLAISGRTEPEVLDIATGNGALVETARSLLAEVRAAISCVDISAAAIDNIRARFPEARGAIADSRTLPFAKASFDLVVSQFGAEYAGEEAVWEAARVVADEGMFALMMHCEGGVIQAECNANLAALRSLDEAQFLPRAIELFRAAFAARDGGPRAPYEEAGARLQPAIEEAEAIIARHGDQVAGEAIVRLYEDVARIHQSLVRYDATEVLEWLSRMEVELHAYAERMAAMSAAAIDHGAFERLCASILEMGLSIVRADALRADDTGEPLAWILEAERRPAPTTVAVAPQETDSPFQLHTEEEVDRAKLEAWVSKMLNEALRVLMAQGVVEERFFEAKPAWVLPFQILIGRVRRPLAAGGYTWFICGEIPTDHLAAGAATSPREAARHFALKWQLAAARMEEGGGAADPGQAGVATGETVRKAEALYALVENDAVWR